MKRKEYVLVTGATSGIGYELAKLFAQDDWNIIAVARSSKDLLAVQDEFREAYSVDFIPMATDLFNPDYGIKLYKDIKQKELTVEILVNDAGQGVYGEFLDTELSREINIIRLNVESLVVLCKLFVKDMAAAGRGKILNVSSIASKSPGPLQSVYHGTKAFVQSFTEALREEVKDKGIVITALLPGVTDTDFFRKADMLNSKAVQDPKKMSDPADVAKDGFDALMHDKDMVVSGTANKIQAAISGIIPDSKLAAKVHKQQEPVDENAERKE